MFGKGSKTSEVLVADSETVHKIPKWFEAFMDDYHKVMYTENTKAKFMAVTSRLDKAADLFAGLVKRVDSLEANYREVYNHAYKVGADTRKNTADLDASRKAVEIAFKAERGIRVIQDQILVSLLAALGYKAVYDDKKQCFVVKDTRKFKEKK